MRWRALVPCALFALGLFLLTHALLPFVAIRSFVEFVAGSASLAVAFLSIPLLWPGAFREPDEGTPPAAPASDAPSSSGPVAILMVGWMPVFVGAWRSATTHLRWLGLVGGSILALFLTLAVVGY